MPSPCFSLMTDYVALLQFSKFSFYGSFRDI